MSGHSKWANIKHKKARTDAVKGKAFTKMGKEIIIAARAGGGDPEGNARLKMLIQKAKAMNMPNDNIDRAVKRGTGEIEGDALEELFYEGYGPGGVALLVSIATDNRNRTASDVRHLFSKHGGNLGESGCVAWMFKRRGVFTIYKEGLPIDAEELELLAIEAGADDIKDEDDYLEIISLPENYEAVRIALESSKIEPEEADISMVPETTVDINDLEMARKLMKLIDLLEEHDDVQDVFGNFDIPDEIMENLE